MTAKPSVGRVVHYVAYGTPKGEFPAGVCRAAIVTQVEGLGPAAPGADAQALAMRVGVAVLNPSGFFFNTGIPQDESGPSRRQPGTWHWPPDCVEAADHAEREAARGK